MTRHRTIVAVTSILLGACSAPTTPVAFSASPPAAKFVQQTGGGTLDDDSGCSFSQGVTTCITTTQREITTTHVETSGCLYGPTGIPGRRSRTFSDTYLVTETTTTLYHGRSDQQISSETTTTTVRIRSTLISDVCEVL